MTRKKRPTNVANVVPSQKKAKKHGKNAAQRQLDADWEKLMASHSKPLERGAKSKGVEFKPPKPKRHSRHIEKLTMVPPLTRPPGREGRKLESLVTPGGDAHLKEVPVYTGTKMKGVATMHKSNSIPVFDDQHLTDIANMRRNDYTRDVKKKPNEEGSK